MIETIIERPTNLRRTEASLHTKHTIHLEIQGKIEKYRYLFSKTQTNKLKGNAR